MARFLETSTSKQQHVLELKVSELYQDLAEFEGEERDELLLLLRDRHTRYLQGGLGQLPGGFVSLDASRPWICYWVLHGLALLDQPLPEGISSSQVIAFLSSCQHPTGGYGGGPGQMPHLAPTYAAVGALLTLGGEEAYNSIDRPGIYDFLCRMAVPPEQGGGFRMHEGGECDARSCYTALAVASNLCLDIPSLVAKSGLVDYVRRCQTYEGGLGGEPGNEAHGGYTFCGLAALMLAGCPQALNLPRLLHWAVQRQGWVEGGFNGRTNKLVDGCYSFWQGGVFPLLQQLMEQQQGQDEQQVLPQLDACCSNVATYPPLEAPSTWQQHQQEQVQEQQEQQQQQELVIPDLPDLSRVLGPLQQAELDSERLNDACDTITQAALRSSYSADAGTEQQQQQQQQQEAAGGAATSEQGHLGDPAHASAESRQQLLQRAQAAQQAAEYSDENAAIAAVSAAVLYPCPGPDLSAAVAAGDDTAGSAAAAAAAKEQSPNPFFNSRALQCWILRACQQLKGGLRDKPGKPADYYHSCYCLSGLSAAQHIAGGGVVGPARNELKQADPLANIVVDKLAQAKAYFGGSPRVAR